MPKGRQELGNRVQTYPAFCIRLNREFKNLIGRHGGIHELPLVPDFQFPGNEVRTVHKSLIRTRMFIRTRSPNEQAPDTSGSAFPD